MTTIRFVLFFAVTAALIYISRTTLATPRAHGFYRFFAWEAIAALVVLNLPAWFRHPLAWHQVISWACLIASIYLVVHGVQLLRMARRAEERQEAGLLAFEKTGELVMAGAYRYIRHPLYSSLLFLAWGAFFKAPGWLGGALALAATLFLTLTAQVEEGENVRFFGAAYVEYMRRTRMFIPFLF